MKKTSILVFILLLTGFMQAQDRPQPKPGNPPTIKIQKPQTFVLSNGLKVLVVENHKLPRVTYNLTLDNAPFAEGNKKGVDELCSNLIGNGSKKIAKDIFNEEIDFYGANLNFSSQGSRANCLSKYANRILELMAEGALNPNFTQEEFDKEKAKMLEGLKADEKSVPAIANRVTEALAFGKNHPSGEFVTEETLKNVTLKDVQANYQNYFVPENAYLVIIGDIKYKKIKPVVEKLFGSWQKKNAPRQTYAEPKNVASTQINFIDMPNAVQSEIALVNTLNLKMSDPDFFAAAIATYILGGDSNSTLNMNLREEHGWTYGANAIIGAGKYVTKLKSASAVRNMVTDSSVVEFIKEIKKIRTEKVSDDVLNRVKAGYIGRFVMRVQQPQTIARYALNIETENLPEDFYENYIKNINAVTADDILRAANKYFLIDNTRIVIAGKASDVIPGLETLKIPIFYFDTFGNPTKKPVIRKEVPAGVSVKSVMENYIKAIGGEKAIQKVKTISMLGSTSMPQVPVPLTFTNKIDSRGKSMVEIAMGPTSLMKQVVNEKEAYIILQGKKKNLEGTNLAEIKSTAKPFEELELITKEGVTLTGIEFINGNEVYAVQNGKTTLYYDTKSGLKIAQTKTMEQGEKTITQTMNYGDYREVNGVKVPFNIIQNMGIELDVKMSEVKINEGVSDADFL